MNRDTLLAAIFLILLGGVYLLVAAIMEAVS